MKPQDLAKLQDLLAEHYVHPDGERALVIAEQAGFEPIGLGGQRLAVRLPDRVVAKLAWRRDGEVDNMIEWKLWSQAGTELRELLCPSLGMIDERVLLQARCLPVASHAIPQAPMLMRELARWGITDGIVNLGMFEGRVVCFDYAVVRPAMVPRLLS